jgi:hypothetical protein
MKLALKLSDMQSGAGAPPLIMPWISLCEEGGDRDDKKVKRERETRFYKILERGEVFTAVVPRYTKHEKIFSSGHLLTL